MTFPLPFQDLLVTRVGALCENGAVKRPLRPSDPDDSAGVFPLTWEPRELEIGQYAPVTQAYPFSIQHIIKAASYEDGNDLHSERARQIREMLYRDPTFHVEFGSLQVTDAGYKERAQRFSVTMQRFLANDIDGTFFYMSVTEAWFETETVFVGG